MTGQDRKAKDLRRAVVWGPVEVRENGGSHSKEADNKVRALDWPENKDLAEPLVEVLAEQNNLKKG
jgi:hypothetical protein